MRRAVRDSKNSKYTDNYLVDFTGHQKIFKQSSSTSRKQASDHQTVTGEEPMNKRQSKMAKKQDDKIKSILQNVSISKNEFAQSQPKVQNTHTE